MVGNNFLCARSEVKDLLAAAEKDSRIILNELKAFLNGDIDIKIYEVEHPMGFSIAGDLTVNGEVCRHYEPVDLCFLDLNEIMLKKMIEAGVDCSSATNDKEKLVGVLKRLISGNESILEENNKRKITSGQ